MTPLAKTSVQIVELNRDFMPSSKSLLLWPLSASGGGTRKPTRTKSNARSGENLEHSPKINNQRQPVVVAKHSGAMRHILRSLLQQILGIYRIRSDHFV